MINVCTCVAAIRMNRPTALHYFRFFAGKSTHVLYRFIIPLYFMPVWNRNFNWGMFYIKFGGPFQQNTKAFLINKLAATSNKKMFILNSFKQNDEPFCWPFI